MYASYSHFCVPTYYLLTWSISCLSFHNFIIVSLVFLDCYWWNHHPLHSSCDYCAVQGNLPRSPQVRFISVCLLYSHSIVFLHQKAYYIPPLSMVWLDSYVPSIRVCTPCRQGFVWVAFMGRWILFNCRYNVWTSPLCEFKSVYYLFSEIGILNFTFICGNFN